MDKRTFLFVLALSLALFGVNIYFENRYREERAAWEAEHKTHESNQKIAEEKTQTSEFKPAPSELSSTNKAEKFYVIENSYQQLVFSNVGGALAEINLPFQNDDDEKSFVKEIAFDREMEKDHPYNAQFPAKSYYTPGATPQTEPVEHKEGKLGGYYPLIRRNLIQTGSRKSVKVPPQFYTFNTVSEYPEVAQLVYEVKHFDEKKIVFEAVQPHRRITKTYSVEPEDKNAPYTINVEVQVEGDKNGLWVTSGVPEIEWISGSPAPALKYRITRNNKSEVILLDPLKEAVNSASIDWILNSNGFFGLIMDPISTDAQGFRVFAVPGADVPTRLVEIEEEFDRFKAADLPGYVTQLPLSTKTDKTQFRLYAGPFAEKALKMVDEAYSNPETGYNPNYISAQTFHGWFAFISEPFARFLFVLMKFFHTITQSWGFSIILLTVALRVMLYPLNAWSAKSMIKMQQISPQVTAIQEKYKKEPQKAQLEIMNLYREKGVNPVSGCLPMLIQMPFLIGMFDLLKSTFELRGASFIPGWIDDLSAPDVLFSWNTPIFFIGNQFHLLPILLGLVMFLQQRMSYTGPSDPNLMTDQQRQQKTMGTIMAFVFAFMFYNFPSGLNIYWLSSMLLGMAQQWWTARRMKAGPLVATGAKKKK